MITCRQMIELLIDYVSGELQPDHKALVEKHLHRCPPCVAYVETYQLTIRITRQLPAAPIPKGLHEKLLACLQELKKGKGCGGEEPEEK